MVATSRKLPPVGGQPNHALLGPWFLIHLFPPRKSERHLDVRFCRHINVREVDVRFNVFVDESISVATSRKLPPVGGQPNHALLGPWFLIHLFPPRKSGRHLDVRFCVVGRGGFEPPKTWSADLQSAPFGRSGIFPCGAGDRNRTSNLLITNQLLCQLSYTSPIAIFRFVVPRGGIEPPTRGFSVPCSTD